MYMFRPHFWSSSLRFHTKDIFQIFKNQINILHLCIGVWKFLYYAYKLCKILLNIWGTRWRSCWGTALQTGRSRVRFPMVSLEFFIDTILPAALWPWGWLSLKRKWVMYISPITGPRCQEGSRKLRLPDYVTMAQDGGKVVSLTHRPLLPPGNTPGTHFC